MAAAAPLSCGGFTVGRASEGIDLVPRPSVVFVYIYIWSLHQARLLVFCHALKSHELAKLGSNGWLDALRRDISCHPKHSSTFCCVLVYYAFATRGFACSRKREQSMTKPGWTGSPGSRGEPRYGGLFVFENHVLKTRGGRALFWKFPGRRQVNWWWHL